MGNCSRRSQSSGGPTPTQPEVVGREGLELRGAPIRSLQKETGPGRGQCSHASWPTCMDAHVILVVGGTGEATTTVGLGAGVGPLACVGTHMYLPDVRCGKGAATALKRTPEWAFTYVDRDSRGGSGGPGQDGMALGSGTQSEKHPWPLWTGWQGPAYLCGSGRASAGLLRS